VDADASTPIVTLLPFPGTMALVDDNVNAAVV
jgi:hypothetical protein